METDNLLASCMINEERNCMTRRWWCRCS